MSRIPVQVSWDKVNGTEKQPPIGILIERFSENMQQIYRRTPVPKCEFSKVAKKLY